MAGKKRAGRRSGSKRWRLPGEAGSRPKKNKYGAVRSEACAITGEEAYDSQKERKRHAALRMLERAGEISNLRRQVPYVLVPKQPGELAVKYLADFVYDDKAGNQVVEDSKGVRTSVYVIKRKLMLFVHGIAILET